MLTYADVCSGRIDMDRIIETLYSDAVTVTFDIVTGFGDTAAYTVTKKIA